MKIFLNSVFALLLMCGQLFATDFLVPKQNIQGTDLPVALGEIVTLNISPIATPPPPSFVSAAYHWKIYDIVVDKDGKMTEVEKPTRELPDGSVIFGTGTEDKTFRILVSATYLYSITDKDGKVSEVGVRHQWLNGKVSVGVDNPGPNPPTPNIEPEFKLSKYSLEGTSYKSAMLDCPRVSRSKGAKALSVVFASLSEKKDGELKVALQAIKPATDKALDDAKVSRADWDKFGTDLQEVVYQLYKDRKLTTAADLAEALTEVSVGLSKVK